MDMEKLETTGQDADPGQDAEPGQESEKKLFESDHVEASWAPENKVFVTMSQEGNTFSVRAHIDDEAKYGDWMSDCPTTYVTKDQGDAERKVREWYDDRENWLTDKYN